MSSAANPAAATGARIRRVLAQARFEALATLRHGEQLLLSILLPVIILIGLSTTGLLDARGLLDRMGDPAEAPVALVLPGVLAVCVVSTAFTGQAIATGFDRRYGVLRHLATTPLGRSGLVQGKLLAVLAVLVVQTLVMGLVAAALGWRPSLPMLLPGALMLLLGTAAFLALGLLVAGTLRAEATLAGANLLWVLFLAGGGLLVEHTGAWGAVTAALPPGALGQGMRAALLEGRLDLAAALVLVLWAAAAYLATVRWFRWS
ncbi:ABC transporter permease [Sediminivirga luteola]|uniref:ABC transporter permease n=1 Tax=Sediminivirga luteola TaxID=1774748 RepID=UPI001F572F37|nr:ABC transporter permease [Sediminivirga luteola]MCI2264083.1 ABC transporter permease [Sediminivirga luteola]